MRRMQFADQALMSFSHFFRKPMLAGTHSASWIDLFSDYLGSADPALISSIRRALFPMPPDQHRIWSQPRFDFMQKALDISSIEERKAYLKKAVMDYKLRPAPEAKPTPESGNCILRWLRNL